MAGRPQLAQMIRDIEEQGGEDALIAEIESGKTIADLARSLGVSRAALSNWLNRTSETKQRIARARETASHALAEEALELSNTATNANEKARRLQVSTRQWLAGKWNRPEYGESPLVNIGISADQLMLSALQKPLPPRPAHLLVGDDAGEGETHGR